MAEGTESAGPTRSMIESHGPRRHERSIDRLVRVKGGVAGALAPRFVKVTGVSPRTRAFGLLVVLGGFLLTAHAGCSYDFEIGSGEPGTSSSPDAATARDATTDTAQPLPADNGKDAADTSVGMRTISCNDRDTCVCDQGETCRMTCQGNGCSMRCEDGANCQMDCPGGQCEFRCEPGAVCNTTCAPGGQCDSDCRQGSTCTGTCTANCRISCMGGTCSQQCTVPQTCNCNGGGCK